MFGGYNSFSFCAFQMFLSVLRVVTYGTYQAPSRTESKTVACDDLLSTVLCVGVHHKPNLGGGAICDTLSTQLSACIYITMNSMTQTPQIQITISFCVTG